MQVEENLPLNNVLCIVGPTGAGKTAAALYLAQKLNGEIINADSRQLYADFPIITAQPNAQEQQVCPHHLYGILALADKLSAMQWAKMAKQKALEVQKRGALPIFVGGTGFYIRTLLDGIAQIPDINQNISQSFLERYKQEGLPNLYKLLLQVDKEYAEKINANDKQRILRALEVWQGTGQSFSWWHNNSKTAPMCNGLRLGIGLELNELTPYLELRIKAMLEAGALQEAEFAMQKSPNPSLAPLLAGWSGIGCQELLQFLLGQISFEEACTLWMRNTRAYAKRQWTWFKADKKIQWFKPNEFDKLLLAAKF